MKKTLLLTITILTFFLSSRNETMASPQPGSLNKSELPGNPKINELEVRGNVQVYLSIGNEENIAMDENQSMKGIKILKENQVLKISSNSPKIQVVWLRLTNLNKISVFDHSAVNSFGKISVLDINVNLYNQAMANLDMNTFNADFVIKDQARAELKGFGEMVIFRRDCTAEIKYQDFISNELSEISNPRLTYPISKLDGFEI
jgi:hypothetical protein